MLVRKILLATIQVSMMLSLTQCIALRVKERSVPVTRLTKPGRGTNEVDQARFRQAYKLVMLARKIENHQPAQAITHYLAAAKTAYQSRDEKLIPLYNHAVGQVVDLLVQHPEEGWGGLENIDNILPVDCLRILGWRTRVRQSGVGAPLVVRRSKASLTGVGRTLSTPIGQSYAVTAVIEFPPNKRPALHLYDPTKKTQIVFWGKPRALANDLTAPLAVSLHEGSSLWKEISLKWFGIFVPMTFAKEMRLYTTAPFDPEKIPVVIVHGLKSDPRDWRNAMNELQSDPELRKRYQFIAFYYPTGLPLRMPSAALKREINKLYGYYAKAGMKKNADQMVIMGHSLGGLITSVQVRKIERGLMPKIFKNPVDESNINQEAMKDYRYLIYGPEPHFVKRVVFLAAPHRGSRGADIYLVRLVSSLIEIPKNLLFLKVPGTTAALTDFGRSLFGDDKKEHSLSLLQSRSATLAILENSPFHKHIKYHSIIGDRGKGNTPNSSDGVVAYRSSHLDGATSEKIVPYRHDVYDCPEGIEEMRRILRLHLRRN